MRLQFVALSLLLGCATLPKGDLVLSAAGASQDMTAMAGATVRVKVLGDPQLDGEVRVLSDGTSAFPLCGNVKVLGLSAAEIEARLRECLAPWLREPAVSVSFVDSGQSVTVLGDLSARVKWEPGLTLISLLLQVGGQGADVVEVRRGEHHAFVSARAIARGEAPNVAVEPGDLVRVECPKCGGVSPHPDPLPRGERERVGVSAVLAVSAPKCAPGTTFGCADRADLARVLQEALPTAGLAARDVRMVSNESQTTLEVTAATAGEADARCTALVLAAQAALPLQADPAREWVQSELLRTREQLSLYDVWLRTLPNDGPCAEETSVPGLKACAQTRLFALGALEPETKDCTEGLMCTVAAQWFDARRRVAELSSRYGPEHPTLRAAAEQRDALQKWFERQKKTEIAALTALMARLPKAGSAQKARLENVLERLEHFDLADGAAEDLPMSLRAAALEYGTVALERTALLSRFLEKHPAVIALDARLAELKEGARKLVPLEVAYLRAQLARPVATPADPRTVEAQRQRENLLRVHELLDRLGEPPQLTVVKPCSSR